MKVYDLKVTYEPIVWFECEKCGYKWIPTEKYRKLESNIYKCAKCKHTLYISSDSRLKIDRQITYINQLLISNPIPTSEGGGREQNST